jgi:hypothetical protein
MSRTTKISASVVTVLASLIVLSLAAPGGHVGLAQAGEAGRGDAGADRSAVLTGRLVRVADANAASCERAPAADPAALDTATKGQFVHLARLAAEIQGRDTIVLPEGLENAGPVPAALSNEQAALAARIEGLALQVGAIAQAKDLAQREIEYTQAKDAALGRQAALLQKELDNVNGLFSKGLAVSGQKLNLEQSVLQSETNRLDVKLLILKAQQEVSKLDRAIVDLRNQWRNEAIAEFGKTQQTIAALAQQAQAAAARQAPRQPDAGACEDTKDGLYVILRGPGGTLQAFPVAAKSARADTVLAQTLP